MCQRDRGRDKEIGRQREGQREEGKKDRNREKETEPLPSLKRASKDIFGMIGTVFITY